MEGAGKNIFYKYCAKRCVKQVSRSVENPIHGGHCWMEWEDVECAPKAEKRYYNEESLTGLIDCTRKQLTLYEAKLSLCETRLQIEQQLVDTLREELFEVKLNAKCLKKCLCGIVFVFAFFFFLWCLI
ncbi:hypothetical protein LIER_15889 [Lithospermum erythrorhizon]|uniref:Uncharacterized protein n=1 Tax=Lithospermum erythrorhizon TaxID=34254 RepID=A0AAV3Q764_LITER